MLGTLLFYVLVKSHSTFILLYKNYFTIAFW
nr:MAG TPA: hypothetical protein [Caudoviricetes sp.]DAX07077.1 MAG TPA: hypothetical protein [Bacteriophage sp.]